jgi:aminobenzoyl-glutamate utilization protein B
MGTGTRVEHEVVSSYWNVLPNETLAAVQHRNLTAVGGVTYTAEEQAFAEAIRKTLISPPTAPGAEAVIQPLTTGLVGSASTDMGDISWNVPTVQMGAATFAPGVPSHSWQAVACAGMSIGTKGMIVAAKTMALTVSDLMTDPALVANAKAEYLKRRGDGFTYVTLAPARPPLEYRKGS